MCDAIVLATRHPDRVQGDYVPTRHLIARDMGDYMSFRAAVILRRVLSVSMEIGWDIDCFVRKAMVPAIRERGIEIPPSTGWVQCEFQAVPPPLFFFDMRYGAIQREDGSFWFLCNTDGKKPEYVCSDGIAYKWPEQIRVQQMPKVCGA